MATREPFVGGNWKMNLRKADAIALAKAIVQRVPAHADVAIAPPFVYLDVVGQAIRGSIVKLAAQNFYFEPQGPFTGEVSLSMLEDLGVRVVLIGHSERRHVIGESNETINHKVRAALDAGFELILCVGEQIEQRDLGQTNAINTAQINFGLAGVEADQMERVSIAYEPVWAIGTGVTARPADAQAAHLGIRQALARLYTPALAETIRIQYGGSVNASNAVDLFAQHDIDGGLIGGASLNADEFVAIVHATASVHQPG
ncbi:MAG: triose-phosphate isomerase [Pirellulaceae bacterium]|jgi:triosephosphate isomerase|nr:triose-phosphate isomerase [Pirellulaceae bacterium]